MSFVDTAGAGASATPAEEAGSSGALDLRASVSLDDLRASADLQQRFDTKYVVPRTMVDALLAGLPPAWRALQIDGRRRQRYVSTYFDTPDFATYRAHQQRRRRRYKIRTRTYASGEISLEVKVKDNAGRTIKRRREHPSNDPAVLPSSARAFVAEQLADIYGFALPEQLLVSAVTQYQRATVANLDAAERFTIDEHLQVHVGEDTFRADPDYVLVETKTASPHGHVDAHLRQLGLRPFRVSKYALGLAVFHPELPSNHWRPAMRKLHPALSA